MRSQHQHRVRSHAGLKGQQRLPKPTSQEPISEKLWGLHSRVPWCYVAKLGHLSSWSLSVPTRFPKGEKKIMTVSVSVRAFHPLWTKTLLWETQRVYQGHWGRGAVCIVAGVFEGIAKELQNEEIILGISPNTRKTQPLVNRQRDWAPELSASQQILSRCV